MDHVQEHLFETVLCQVHQGLSIMYRNMYLRQNCVRFIRALCIMKVNGEYVFNPDHPY